MFVLKESLGVKPKDQNLDKSNESDVPEIPSFEEFKPSIVLKKASSTNVWFGPKAKLNLMRQLSHVQLVKTESTKASYNGWTLDESLTKTYWVPDWLIMKSPGRTLNLHKHSITSLNKAFNSKSVCSDSRSDFYRFLSHSMILTSK